jgi:tetratricopeptide (TPR) repeat protein
MLAVVHRTLGQLDEARQLLDAALVSSPDDILTLVERGNVDMDMEKLREAERYFRRAAELAPQEPKPHFALSRCLQLQGKTAEASRHQRLFERLEAEQQREKKPAGS